MAGKSILTDPASAMQVVCFAFTAYDSASCGSPVGWPPTESCTALLIKTCLKLLRPGGQTVRLEASRSHHFGSRQHVFNLSQGVVWFWRNYYETAYEALAEDRAQAAAASADRCKAAHVHQGLIWVCANDNGESNG